MTNFGYMDMANIGYMDMANIGYMDMAIIGYMNVKNYSLPLPTKKIQSARFEVQNLTILRSYGLTRLTVLRSSSIVQSSDFNYSVIHN